MYILPFVLQLCGNVLNKLRLKQVILYIIFLCITCSEPLTNKRSSAPLPILFLLQILIWRKCRFDIPLHTVMWLAAKVFGHVISARGEKQEWDWLFFFSRYSKCLMSLAKLNIFWFLWLESKLTLWERCRCWYLKLRLWRQASVLLALLIRLVTKKEFMSEDQHHCQLSIIFRKKSAIFYKGAGMADSLF